MKHLLILIIPLLYTLTSCDEFYGKKPNVKTTAYSSLIISDYNKVSVTLNGKLVPKEKDNIMYKGICWSKNPVPNLTDDEYILCDKIQLTLLL